MNGTLQSGTQTYRWTQVLPATILLVEDEATVREVTREVLEMSCYHVLTADGAMAAAHVAGDEATAIDLLLTDVVMPGINGVELARQIRELRPELATLFMTGYAEGEFLRVAALGAQQKHIKKPFTVSSLLAGVADALAARWNISNRNLNPQYPSP